MCLKFGYSLRTFYRSINIVDKIFSKVNLMIDNRNLLIYIGLYIASKLEESDKSIPYIEQVLP